jgi:hypothetical protein
MSIAAVMSITVVKSVSLEIIIQDSEVATPERKGII